jgi:hypothetical protein
VFLRYTVPVDSPGPRVNTIIYLFDEQTNRAFVFYFHEHFNLSDSLVELVYSS